MEEEILEEPVTTLRTVTCHTEGCENAEIPITFRCTDYIICGVCGQRILDVKTA